MRLPTCHHVTSIQVFRFLFGTPWLCRYDGALYYKRYIINPLNGRPRGPGSKFPPQSSVWWQDHSTTRKRGLLVGVPFRLWILQAGYMYLVSRDKLCRNSSAVRCPFTSCTGFGHFPSRILRRSEHIPSMPSREFSSKHGFKIRKRHTEWPIAGPMALHGYALCLNGRSVIRGQRRRNEEKKGEALWDWTSTVLNFGFDRRRRSSSDVTSTVHTVGTLNGIEWTEEKKKIVLILQAPMLSYNYRTVD